jgi:hypothetical protein
MKAKGITLLALLLFGTLTLTGCCGLSPGPRRCGPPGEMTDGQTSCQQQKNCVKADCHKPCCKKMQGAETPAQ